MYFRGRSLPQSSGSVSPRADQRPRREAGLDVAAGGTAQTRRPRSIGVEPQPVPKRDLQAVDRGEVAPGAAVEEVGHRLAAQIGFFGEGVDGRSAVLCESVFEPLSELFGK